MNRLKDHSDVPEARLWVMLVTWTREPEGREFVVDSGACMQILSASETLTAELDTMRTSRSAMTVMTANGEMQTRERATIYTSKKWTYS